MTVSERQTAHLYFVQNAMVESAHRIFYVLSI